MSNQMTHTPGQPFTMSDEDAERFMRAPRRDSRIEKTLNPQPTRYVMQGSYGPSKSRNRKRKFKR